MHTRMPMDHSLLHLSKKYQKSIFKTKRRRRRKRLVLTGPF